MKLLLGFAIAPSSSALGVRRLAFGAQEKEREGGRDGKRQREIERTASQCIDIYELMLLGNGGCITSIMII